MLFLPRHGQDHSIAPRRINYRANLWALHQQGVTEIIAVAAVGGIHSDLAPAMLAVPDHIIDYTHNREQSFHSEDFSSDKHIDFSYPHDQALRERILAAAKQARKAFKDVGVKKAAPRREVRGEEKEVVEEVAEEELSDDQVEDKLTAYTENIDDDAIEAVIKLFEDGRLNKKTNSEFYKFLKKAFGNSGPLNKALLKRLFKEATTDASKEVFSRSRDRNIEKWKTKIAKL